MNTSGTTAAPLTVTAPSGGAVSAPTRATSTITDLARLAPSLRGERGPLLWTALVDLAANVSLIALSVTTAHLVATAVLYGRADEGPWWVAAVVLALLRPVLTWHEMDVSHAVAYRVLAALRMALYDGYARGVPSRGGVHSGRLAATAMTDVEKLEFFYAHTVAQMAAAAVLVVVGVPVAAWVSPALAGVLVAGLVLLVVTTWPLLGRGERWGATQQHRRTELSERAVDLLAGTREILVFDRREQAVADLAAAAARADAPARRLRAVEAWGAGIRESVVVLTSVALMLVAAGLPGCDPVWVPCLLAGSLTFFAPIAEAVAVAATLQPHRASARRVAEGMSLGADIGAALPGPGPERERVSGVAPVSAQRQQAASISTRGVRFDYPGRAPIMVPDLEIEPGELVGVAGPSGVGKSTLARLLTGLWRADAGMVLLGGRTPEQIPAGEWPSWVQLVEQDAPLVHGSLAHNLRLGAPDATDGDLESALQQVGLSVTDEAFPLGLDTAVGEDGTTLSGGQRARVALARALLLEPQILVLDETTAALDAAAESAVMDVVEQLRCTVLVISHRERTLARTPRVIRWLP
ncbi:putative ABC transporter ATP-binding/permease protein [Austwickia sp. TVS 96-490-7B]|uniref:ATP-binding cassette domain-containing protein n=1 Tax=Austwickia sp. TVS 96-490-7B TaxID=2830843 RepID=UPI001C5A4D2C|nr:ABC transporter ATP-binding protein [Austwickia sp. TVS 96-490-7B]MBW3085510.1 putative ABC transporter ATP-binding/permease protein [Austwickia sp. TVS 96-490-7B]